MTGSPSGHPSPTTGAATKPATPAANAEAETAAADVDPAAASASQEMKLSPFAWRNSQFTALPIQMFNWTSRPQAEFHRTAAAAGIILIVMTLSLNSVAIYMRARLRKKIKW